MRRDIMEVAVKSFIHVHGHGSTWAGWGTDGRCTEARLLSPNRLEVE
jgi:hypothetical protein